MPIRVLSPLLVNQIAAGEVVERPASVVKELLENALDAGAGSIRIRLEGGGRERIEIVDDGAGIPAEELPLAVASHATSKIARPEDLASIATMGFRGEALASIASVARLRICSRPAEADEGAALEVDGGRVGEVRPAAAPHGTSIDVRTLFFNTPARRRFLRSARAETTRINEIVSAIAMSHPGVGVRLEHDGRTTLDLPPGQSRRERVVATLGSALEPELLEVEDRTGEPALGLWGLVGLPGVARATGRHVRLFLNGRLITDRSLVHALREAYRGLIEPSRTPVGVLFLTLDPREVDVNVHPAKTEVRFRNPALLHSLVRRSVRRRLEAEDLVPALDLERTSAGTTWTAPSPAAGPASVGDGRAPSPSSPSMRSSSAGRGGGATLDRGAPSRSGTPAPSGAWSDVDIEVMRRSLAPVTDRPVDAGSGPSPDDPTPAALPTIRAAVDVMQVQKQYLVTQDEHGLVIIDQHALHERVMFERLRERVERGALESQQLLDPVIVETDAAGTEALESMQPLLNRLGIEARGHGAGGVAVHAFPSLLFSRGVEPGPFLGELLQRAGDGGLPPDSEAALSEVLDMMACKAAIKAGDRLSQAELAELLALRDRVERSSNCPHGRPTSLRLTVRDLDRQFGRG